MIKQITFVGLLLLYAGSVSGEVLTISIPGYSADVGVHEARGTPLNVVVISLHGKERGRTHSGNVAYANALAKNGYTVYTPQMPWSDYSAPVQTAFHLLDALITKVAADGRKVFIAGHSQGAPYALFYTTRTDTLPQVAGTILLAPGHLIHRSERIREATASSVKKAREMVEAGKGHDTHWFNDFNAGGGVGAKKIRSTAQTYLTYFDPEASLNFLEEIKRATLPLLWIDGKNDKLAERMRYREIFLTAPQSSTNRYEIVDGGHVDMWETAAVPTISWLADVRAQVSIGSTAP
ncbi:MAG: alpha/beta fold hydrolase [Chloroflexota bacterium]